MQKGGVIEDSAAKKMMKRCDAYGVMPSSCITGPPMATVVKYAAVTGKPIPRIMHTKATSTRAATEFPCDNVSTTDENRTQMPVRYTMLMTMPSAAKRTVRGAVERNARAKAASIF